MGDWTYVKSASATAYDYSTCTKVIAKTSLSTRGRYRIRAYHPADSANAATWTGYRCLTVK